MLTRQRINVTRAVRPSRLRTIFHINKVLNSRWYTNDGSYLKKFELELCDQFDLHHAVVMTNGTLPLLGLLQQYNPGQVLTTPFSFVATTSSILMSGHTPVFVDIDQKTLQVSIPELEKLLENNTFKAMLFTHVYGRPENISELERISQKYQVDLLFDASHCVGVKYLGKSVFEYGKASTLSLHATKILSSTEGGVVFTKDDLLAAKMREWRNFGISNGEISSVGINAKMNEFSSVLGLESLRTLNQELSRRKEIAYLYFKELSQYVEIVHSPNSSYFPILLKNEAATLKLVKDLQTENVYPRRYFYPPLNRLPFIDNQVTCLNAEEISTRILCLPIGDDVTNRKAIKISQVVINSLA